MQEKTLAGLSSRRMRSLASAAGYKHSAPVLAAPSQADVLEAIRVYCCAVAVCFVPCYLFDFSLVFDVARSPLPCLFSVCLYLTRRLCARLYNNRREQRTKSNPTGHCMNECAASPSHTALSFRYCDRQTHTHTHSNFATAVLVVPIVLRHLNELLSVSLSHTVTVTYNQLQHINSDKFLSVMPRERADMERDHVKVSLADSDGNEACWLQVAPGIKCRATDNRCVLLFV